MYGGSVSHSKHIITAYVIINSHLDVQVETRGNSLKKKKKHRSQYYDLYRNSSLGSAMQAFCMNLHTGASLCQHCKVQYEQTKGGAETSLCCGHNESLNGSFTAFTH